MDKKSTCCPVIISVLGLYIFYFRLEIHRKCLSYNVFQEVFKFWVAHRFFGNQQTLTKLQGGCKISFSDSSFYHTFTANGEKVTKTPTGQTTWKVEWNGRDQIKNTFLTRSAVEARSLDRGFRIITTELQNSLQNK